MKLLHKVVVFLTGFTLLFVLLRTTEHFNNHLLMEEIDELAGVPWLYSVIGLMFSILAAFVIQTEWKPCCRLAGSVKMDDLDQPLRPGIWQLTTKDDQRRLRTVEAGAASRMAADHT